MDGRDIAPALPVTTSVIPCQHRQGRAVLSLPRLPT